MHQTKWYCFWFYTSQSLAIYTGDPKYWETIPDIIEMHRLIKQTGLPNYLGARIPVPTQRRPERWHLHLNDFWDKQIVDLIQHGFPLDF